MKKILLLVLLHFPLFQFGQTSPFDTLHTRESLNSFLVKNFYEYYKIAAPEEAYRTPALLKLADSLQTKMWIKVDLDQNGYTDLIFNRAVHLEAVLVFPGNKLKNFRLSKPPLSGPIAYYPEVIMPDKTPLLVIRKKVSELGGRRKQSGQESADQSPYTFSRPFRTDTLVYKSRGFMEYNPNFRKGKVDYVKVETTGCFGTCPVFDISIKGDKCVLIAKSNVNNVAKNVLQGTYTGTLQKQDKEDLEGILTYIDSGKLRKRYYINEDAPGATLQYSVNNKTYEVDDNGLIGTLALQQLFELIHDIVEKTDWKKQSG